MVRVEVYGSGHVIGCIFYIFILYTAYNLTTALSLYIKSIVWGMGKLYEA